MSKLQALIEQLCPDGVEYKALGEVCENIFSGKNKERSDIGQYSVYGSTGIIGYSDDFVYDYNTVLIARVGANCGYVHMAKGCYDVSDNTLIVKTKPNIYDLKFAYYQLLNMKINQFAKGGGQPLVTAGQLKAFVIPIPPLEVQHEIIRILDNFTELTAELAAELQKRREQYRHYSTMLFDDAKKSGVHSIEEVCHIEKGKTPIQKAIPGGYPMVVTTTERKSCDTYQFDAKAVCVPLVSSRGHGVASLNHVYYQEGKFALGNILCAIIPKNEEQVYPKYLYYYFEQTKEYTLVPLMKGGANVALHMNDVKKVKVPIPSLKEQKRIVYILDRFETLCNDISSGLPAEIEARKKQYEYYRDKMLSFENVGDAV